LPQIWGLKNWSKKCFHPHLGPHLGPTSCLHFYLSRNNGKSFLKFFLRTFPSSISTKQTKELGKASIYLLEIKFKNWKRFFQHPHRHLDHHCICICQRKSGFHANFILQCILNLHTYLWKSMHESNHYYLRYERLKSGKRNPSIRTFIHTMAPPPICICVYRGNTIRGFSKRLFGRMFPSSISTNEKKENTLKADHFSSRNGGSKLKKSFPTFVRAS
jgi:hypothetical protein